MNYSKLDAGLSAAVTIAKDKECEPLKLNIFIRIADKVYTATLSIKVIDELSEQAWIRGMSLGRQLHLLSQLESY